MCIDKFEEIYHKRQCFQLNNNEARWRRPRIEDDICVIFEGIYHERSCF